MLTVGRRFGSSNLRIKLQENLHVGYVVIKDQETEHLEIPLPSDLHVHSLTNRLIKEPSFDDCQDSELKTERIGKYRPGPQRDEGIKKGRKEVLCIFG
jgi:hypothetical protein